MQSARDIDLVNELRAQPDEMEWLEFKVNNADPEMIGLRCSALSNAARMVGRETAFMLWGIEDGSHRVIGTGFHPESEKVGNQPLQLWLAQRLQPSIAFAFREVSHPDGRVVLLEIPAATGAPVCFNGTPYIRIGSATPKRIRQWAGGHSGSRSTDRRCCASNCAR